VERGVVITGTSTGIGRATALALDRLGYRVFAGVRRQEDARSLAEAGSERLVPIQLEVTDAKAIDGARRHVEEIQGAAGLAGLVNNAGVLFSGPLEFLPLEDLRQQFEVNVFGDIAVTQTFLPLIRQGRGRVVNVGSVAGKVSAPFVSPLSASKFAMESLNDALRMELRPWNIPVVLIEPGFVASAAPAKVAANVEQLCRRLPPEGVDRYGEIYRRAMAQMVRDNVKGITSEAVARVVVRALTARRPRTRYAVGRDAKALTVLARLLPDRLLDRIRARVFGL
jgi:NAD(P)-dependent dehydrogenase (short-subunit alcohol dehydrogenase family)